MAPETIGKNNHFEVGLSMEIATSCEDTKGSSENQEKVRLVSSDGHVFTIDRQMALLSKTLAMFLDPTLNWQESATGTVLLQDVNGRLLSRVVDFLRCRYVNETSQSELPFEIQPEESLELLLVADYLEM